jgi:glycerate-2-kinase
MLKDCSGILQNPDIAVFIERIISSCLSAVDPQSTVRKLLKIHQGFLQVGDQLIRLDSNNRIRLVSIGKAALKMAAGAIDALGKSIFDGIGITKTMPDQTTFCFPSDIRILIGGHPIPTEESILCGQELKRFLKYFRRRFGFGSNANRWNHIN